MKNEETILDEKLTNGSKPGNKSAAKPAGKNDKWIGAAAGAVVGAGAAMAGQAFAASDSQDEAVTPEENTEAANATNVTASTAAQNEEVVVNDDVTIHHVHHVHHEHTFVDDPDPVEPEPIEPDPVEPDPIEPDPIEPDPIEPDPDDPVEVHIIGAGETDLDGDGQTEYSVALDCNGQEILIVDIDRDNYADVAIADLNGNGTIEEDEIVDVSEEHALMPGMEEQDSNVYMANNDDMPDYMNDADTDSYMA